MDKRGKRAGFTLIELLVVIAIISILAGMLLPALANARDSAKLVVCLGQMKQLGLANQMYVNDFSEILPPVVASNTDLTYLWQATADNPVGYYGIGLLYKTEAGSNYAESPCDYGLSKNLALNCPGREGTGRRPRNPFSGYSVYAAAFAPYIADSIQYYYPKLNYYENNWKNTNCDTITGSMDDFSRRVLFYEVRSDGATNKGPTDIPHNGTSNFAWTDGSAHSLRGCWNGLASIVDTDSRPGDYSNCRPVSYGRPFLNRAEFYFEYDREPAMDNSEISWSN
jgi:prepilin-type N-terminal cleavage/methylation domain-containing protein/prepilin-type processing-associated H-X9-DG protein